jgi:hypothetical protein
MIEVSATLELDKKTMKVLEKFPSKFLYSMASQTLDLGYVTIPLSDQKNRGRLRSSSRAYGVQQHTDTDYSIGSQTDYAAYVWIMDNETTNWTTPGTGSEWYARTLKEKQDLMVANAIEEANK